MKNYYFIELVLVTALSDSVCLPEPMNTNAGITSYIQYSLYP